MIPAFVDTIDFEGAVSLVRASHIKLRALKDGTYLVYVVMGDGEAFTVFRGSKPESQVYLRKLKRHLYCLSSDEVLKVPANPWVVARAVSDSLTALKSSLEALNEAAKGSRKGQSAKALTAAAYSLAGVIEKFEQALK